MVQSLILRQTQLMDDTRRAIVLGEQDMCVMAKVATNQEALAQEVVGYAHDSRR